jgi:glutathione synthase/RimK-type ligase-like ATP-grasp enzyme
MGMSIAILYEHPETDELGIKATAQEMGVELIHIPFRLVSITVGNDAFRIRSKAKEYTWVLEHVGAVLNRAQSKNRRLYASSIMEALGKPVINSSRVEYICFSKLRTLLEFRRAGVKIPKSVFVPCNSHEFLENMAKIHNEVSIADLLEMELDGTMVIKPDSGTHGRDVRLVKSREALIQLLEDTQPSIINPVGIFAQEFVDKWFYDLRIVVSKERGKPPSCHPLALARAGFKDFRTNTFLGNMVFGVKLPAAVMEAAERCGMAIGGDSAWILALDAMPRVEGSRPADDECIRSDLEKLEPYFDNIKKVKRNPAKMKDFQTWNKRLEEAFDLYKRTEPYERVRRAIEENLEKVKDRVMFHEANSCPEFWEQTRLMTGANLAEHMIKCALSVANSG